MKKRHTSVLSTVVNDLMRAAAGSGASDVPDEDLDKYIADLIAKEAKAKRQQYENEGVRAYLPDTGLPPNRLPKTNKRFLINTLRATSSHNQALARSAGQHARDQDDRSISRSRSIREDIPEDHHRSKHDKRSRRRHSKHSDHSDSEDDQQSSKSHRREDKDAEKDGSKDKRSKKKKRSHSDDEELDRKSRRKKSKKH